MDNPSESEDQGSSGPELKQERSDKRDSYPWWLVFAIVATVVLLAVVLLFAYFHEISAYLG